MDEENIELTTAGGEEPSTSRVVAEDSVTVKLID